MSATRFPDVMLLTAGNRLALEPVAGLPLVERVMANARAEGAIHFVANGMAGEHAVLAHFGGLVKVSREEQPLGSGGGVRQALPMLHSDPFFVLETTSVWQAGKDRPLRRMLSTPVADDAIVLLCVHPHQAVGVHRSHDFCLAPDGMITRDYGAPVLYAGAALLSKARFRAAAEGAFGLDALFDTALEAERLHGVVLDAPWFAVRDQASLALAEQRLVA